MGSQRWGWVDSIADRKNYWGHGQSLWGNALWGEFFTFLTYWEENPFAHCLLFQVPSAHELTVRVGYDSSLMEQESDPESWIAATLTHAQTLFYHPSLGSQIKLKVGKCNQNCLLLSISYIFFSINDTKLKHWPALVSTEISIEGCTKLSH